MEHLSWFVLSSLDFTKTVNYISQNMIFHQIGGQTVRRTTFWNKVSLILWIGASLALLSFFTFTLFVIALVVGVVIFTLRFFRQKQPQTTNNQYSKNNPFTNQGHRSRPSKDDDIIDIWSFFTPNKPNLNYWFKSINH